MALDHGADNAPVPPGDLAGDVPAHVDLLLRLLAAVSVTEVDHHPRAQARVFHLLCRHVNALGVVVRSVTTTQNDMGIRVAGSGEDGRAPLLGHRQKMVRVSGGVHGVQGNAQTATGGVLEAYWTGQAGGQLPMPLALSGAGADGPPTDEIGNVLRADEIEELGPRRHPQAVDIHQQGAGQLEALVDLEAAVQVGVVDQPLPAHGGPWLLEVDAHDDQQVLG